MIDELKHDNYIYTIYDYEYEYVLYGHVLIEVAAVFKGTFYFRVIAKP